LGGGAVSADKNALAYLKDFVDSGVNRASSKLKEAWGDISLPDIAAMVERAKTTSAPNPLTAEVAQKPGVAALGREYESGDLQTQRNVNAQNRAQTISATIGSGNVDSVQALAQAKAKANGAALDDATAKIGPVVDDATSGNNIRQPWTTNLKQAQGATGDAYNVPELTNPLPIYQSDDDAKSLFNGITSVSKRYFGDAGGHAPGNPQQTIYDLFSELGDDNINTNTLANVDRRLSNFQGSSNVAGNYADADFVKNLRNTIQDHFADRVPPEYTYAINNAKAVRADQGARFESGKVANAMEREFNRPTTPDVQVPDKIFPHTTQGAANVDELINAVGSPSTEQFVREHLARQLNDGKLNTPMSITNARNLTTKFPNLEDDLMNLQTQRGVSSDFENSQLGKMVNPDLDTNLQIHGLLDHPDPNGFGNFLQSVQGNPDAVAGVRQSLADYVIKKLGEGGKYDANNNLIPSNNANGIKAIDTVRQRGGSLLTDDQHTVLQAMQDQLKAGEAAKTSGVTDNMTDNSDFGSGHIPGLRGGFYHTIKFVLSKVNNENKVTALTRQALANPDFASELLMRPTPQRTENIANTIRRGARAGAIGSVAQAPATDNGSQ
jgi:hypothetical protein